MQTVSHTRREHLRLVSVATAGLVTAGCTNSAGAASQPRSVAGCRGPAVNVFPGPGTPVASRRTQISFRGRPASELGPVQVVGSESGEHRGKLRAHSDGKGASFVPGKPFEAGEEVTVRSGANIHGSGCGNFSFTIGRFTDAAPPPLKEHSGSVQEVQSFRSRPDLKPPAVTVNIDKDPESLGHIFVAANGGPGQNGPMVLDSHGELVWFTQLDGEKDPMNFRVQRYQDEPVLTWWEGEMKRGYAPGSFVIADTSYRRIKRVYAAGGFEGDAHEFLITPHGTALLVCYQGVSMDLSSMGGPSEAAVIDSVVQEVDIATGLMVFEWHSIGHIGLDETYSPMLSPEEEKGAGYDFAHVNSVDIDQDGNLIVSARHTNAVYKLDRGSGAIMWRLGGKRSDFTVGSDAGFRLQHDARSHPDGTFSIFDNENVPETAEESRSIVLDLDTEAMKATLKREYTHPEKLFAKTQGNGQRLDDGSMFVGWGSQPYLTLFSESGEVLFDARFSSGNMSYRAFTFPWKATPDDKPAAAVAAGDGNLTVYASWNGATEVADWQVLAGSGEGNLAPVGSPVARDGFETEITVSTSEPYVAAQARDSARKVLAASPMITLRQ